MTEQQYYYVKINVLGVAGTTSGITHCDTHYFNSRESLETYLSNVNENIDRIVCTGEAHFTTRGKLVPKTEEKKEKKEITM